MKNIKAVFKREFKAYMNNVYGYLFGGVLLLFCGALVSFFNILGRMSAIEYTLYYGRYVLLLMIPILCMRSMAEDRHNKTDMFYLSLPLSTYSVVLGKFWALVAVFAIPTGGALPLPPVARPLWLGQLRQCVCFHPVLLPHWRGSHRRVPVRVGLDR